MQHRRLASSRSLLKLCRGVQHTALESEGRLSKVATSLRRLAEFGQWGAHTYHLERRRQQRHAAVGLAREHGVYAAAQALRLSYDSLRKRAEAAVDARRVRRESRQPQATFVELLSELGLGPRLTG